MHRLIVHGQAVLACMAGLVLSACSRPSPSPAVPPTARHVVLVTIDTLRADRLGCYGNGQVATPNLDRLAKEGALAPQATVHTPLTRPSHVSLFTGLLPSEHGIRDNVSPALVPGVPTLASLLKAAGFRTGAFVSSVVLASQSGLDRGFDTYADRFEGDRDDARFLNTIQKRGDHTLGEALSWLDADREERAFAWIHLYDPHDPYEPPEPYATRYRDRPYDGEVAWTDELIGRLDAQLERSQLKEATLLVVTSDHGEGLGEHGERLHGFFVYEATLRVPLLVRGPGVVPGARLAVTARTVDLLPTVLELAGIALPAGLAHSGRSLAGALRGDQRLDEEASYAESLTPLLHFGWSDLRALREGRWKYIEAPRPELYDLDEDPAETRNLTSMQPSRAEALRGALARRLGEERAGSGAVGPGAATVPPELLEKLGALGYLGLGAPAQASSPGADPKDKIEEFKLANRLVREGLIHLREKRYAESAVRFRELLRRGIESFAVHYYLARGLFAQQRYEQAARHFENALRYQPAYGQAHQLLAECRVEMGDLPAALKVLEKGQAQSPQDASLHQTEAAVHVRMGQPRDAVRAYEAALALAPRRALIRVRLGELFRDLGDSAKAIEHLREAVVLDPGPASYWNALGLVLGGNGRLAEAEDAFLQALERDPGNAQYAYNLGLALQRQGRADEAAKRFRRALDLQPGFAPARARLAEIGTR